MPAKRSSVAFRSLLPFAAVLAVSSLARADGGMWGSGHSSPTPYVPPPPAPPFGCVCIGAIAGPQASAASGWTLGGELSLFVHPDGASVWGHGAFLQVQRYFGSGASMRYAGGYELGGPLGIELGGGVRMGDAGTSPSLHIAPYASLGYAHLAVRASPGIGVYGSEVSVLLGVKLPVLWGDPKI